MSALKLNFDVKKLPDYVNIPPFYHEVLKLWSENNCFEPVQVVDNVTGYLEQQVYFNW